MMNDFSSWGAYRRYQNSVNSVVDMKRTPNSSSPSIQNAIDSSSALKEDFKNLYTEHKFCDATLQTPHSSFPVHKAILCARSPVFKAMFERDMKENTTGIVDICDLDDDTVNRLLLFMYTDTVEDLQWEGVVNLYFAADKYEILSLKYACSTYLRSNLSVSNSCQLLELSDLHNDVELKTAAQDFIFKCDREVMSSEEWKTLKENKLELVCETLQLMYMKKINT